MRFIIVLPSDCDRRLCFEGCTDECFTLGKTRFFTKRSAILLEEWKKIDFEYREEKSRTSFEITLNNNRRQSSPSNMSCVMTLNNKYIHTYWLK